MFQLDYKFILLLGLAIVIYFLYKEIRLLKNKYEILNSTLNNIKLNTDANIILQCNPCNDNNLNTNIEEYIDINYNNLNYNFNNLNNNLNINEEDNLNDNLNINEEDNLNNNLNINDNLNTFDEELNTNVDDNLNNNIEVYSNEGTSEDVIDFKVDNLNEQLGTISQVINSNAKEYSIKSNIKNFSYEYLNKLKLVNLKDIAKENNISLAIGNRIKNKQELINNILEKNI